MNLHRITEYLKYKWLAKGRHGTHSPYVYDFVETILQDRRGIGRCSADRYPALTEEYNLILCRMLQYYRYNQMVMVQDERSNASPKDILILPAGEPMMWGALVQRCLPLLNNDGVIFMPDIHTDRAHTEAWDMARGNEQVMMSIDLYGAGLLVLREEFKVKQHFILKDKA